MASQKPRYVYVENNDYFWRLTEREWRAICQRGAQGYGHDLTPYKQLAGPPKFIRRDREEGGYWHLHSVHRFYAVTDFDVEDYENAMADMAEEE